ncbi:MAG: GNAT family N-acetyltransferase [Acidimicrobiales bacterium]
MAPRPGRPTPEQLERQLAEPWVELPGFLVLDDPDRGDRLAGSCWTRVHEATVDDPALGEIFVIGVDPDRHGRGLGAALVLAGLDHLAARGLRTGMLYVEADNAAARRLYERLGFTVHERRRIRS